MSEWHKNIPEKGMLAINGDDDVEIIVGMTVDYDTDGFAYNDAVSKSGDTFDIKHLRPITAEEWWDFAPWQDMDTLAAYDNVLLTDFINFEKGFINDNGRAYGALPISPSPLLAFTPIKWLPLPLPKAG
jgi:hypothetical protein